MDGAPSPLNPTGRGRKNTPAVKRNRTAAARAAKAAANTSESDTAASPADGAESSHSSTENQQRVKWTRRSTSPALSIASNTSDGSEPRPSRSRNRLLVTSNETVRHTSNLSVCSGRRKLTTGSRANRLRPQNPRDFERPSRLPPNLLSTCRPNREKLVITVCPDGLWTSSRDVNAPPTRYDL